MISWLRRLARSHPIEDSDLSAYADGQIPPARVAAVEAHVATCEACRAHVAELRAVRSMLASLPEAAARRSFALTPEIAFATPRPEPRRTPAPMWAPALALSVLVLLLAVDLVDVGGDEAGSAGTLASSQEKAAGSAQDNAFSGAAAPTLPAPRTGPAASGGQPAAQPQVASEASADKAVPSQAPEAARSSAAQATASAPRPSAAVNATGDDRASGLSTLRLLEGLAALGFLGSIAYVWWYKSRRSAY